MKTQTLTLLLALKWLAFALLTLPAPAPAQWGNDPWNGQVTVCDMPGNQEVVRACSLAGNKTFVAWGDARIQPQRIYYQILNQQGLIQVAANGLPLIEGNWLTSWASPDADAGGRVLPDGQGGCIAVFRDDRNGNPQVYGQRFDSLGNRLWGNTGLPLAIWPGVDEMILKDVTADSLNNIFIAWCRDLIPNQLYEQKVNTSGQRLWGDYGVIDCGNISMCDWQQIVPDGQGGVIDVWSDNRLFGGEDFRLFAQHLNANGTPLWAVNGISLTNPQTGQPLSVNALGGGVSDGSGGGVWSYDTYWNWYLFHLSSTGQVLWLYSYTLPNTCQVGYPLRHPADGTIWLTSLENLSAGNALYLYHFDLSGRMLSQHLVNTPGIYPAYTKVPVQCLTSDGVIAVSLWWQGENLQHVQATRVSNTGVQAWQSDVSLCHSYGYGQTQTCIADGTVCAWSDFRYETTSWKDVFAQRVLSNGQLGNPSPNPHRPDTPNNQMDLVGHTVQFSLSSSGEVRLELYNVLGEKVRTMLRGYQPAGTHQLALGDQDLAAGIYFLTLQTEGERRTLKIAVVK